MNRTVLNLTKNCYVKRNQALRRESECEIEFVSRDEFRELTNPERLQRMEQRRISGWKPISDHLPPINGRDIIERMPKSQVFTQHVKHELLVAAGEFYACPTQSEPNSMR